MFFGLFWPSLVLLFQVNTVSTQFKLSLSQETSRQLSHCCLPDSVRGSSLVAYFPDFVLTPLV